MPLWHELERELLHGVTVIRKRFGGMRGFIGLHAPAQGLGVGVALAGACFKASDQGGPVLALWVASGVAMLGCVVSLSRLAFQQPRRG